MCGCSVEEREDKFEVDPDWVMPQLKRLVPDGGRLDQEVRTLDNTYFDTPGAGLRLFGVTLRRRVGGSETGWQLKVPSGMARTELQTGSHAKTVPPVLAKSLVGLRAGERLGPVARMQTARTAYRVLNADGGLVLEIADDEVESGPPDAESTLHAWREVEVELGPAGKKRDLKQARKLLQAAGATPSAIGTKLDRALGLMSADRQEPAALTGTVGELVGGYVAAQRDVLASNDIGLRTGARVVHPTRVAARRLRSTLRVFGDMADAAAAERDREVLSARLTKLIAALPPEHVRGPVEAEINADDDVERLHRARKNLQTLLGEHQDAVVAANFLSTISASSDGENGSFTYGVLVANELNRAAEIRESLRNKPSRSHAGAAARYPEECAQRPRQACADASAPAADVARRRG